MLTLWLAAPILVVIGLVAMIFVTLDKDKLMADAKPIGAGAGDTGDANALGQLLFGRDPDEVSLANKAKRERLLIDPRDWPGGIKLRVSSALIADAQGVRVELRREGEEAAHVALEIDADGDGLAMLTHRQVKRAALWLVQPGREAVRIYTDLVLPEPDLQVADPMVVEVDG